MVAGSKEQLSEESPYRASLDAITRGRYKQEVTTYVKALEGSRVSSDVSGSENLCDELECCFVVDTVEAHTHGHRPAATLSNANQRRRAGFWSAYCYNIGHAIQKLLLVSWSDRLERLKHVDINRVSL